MKRRRRKTEGREVHELDSVAEITQEWTRARADGRTDGVTDAERYRGVLATSSVRFGLSSASSTRSFCTTPA